MRTRLRNTLRLVTVAALAAVSAVTFAAAPASAAPGDAFDRCNRGEAPNDQFNVSIAGTMSSVVVGGPDKFWRGDVFRIRAGGTIRTSALIWDNYTPNGREGDLAPRGNPAWPGPGLTKFSLVGAFGPDPGNMQFGTTVWCVVVPDHRDRTYLRMWINDDMTNDNSGRWDISVDHYWA